MLWRRKAKETTLNNFEMKFERKWSFRSNSTEKELNAEKFFKEEYNLEMNFSGITTDKTTK
jgi:hypothetical protein